MEEENVQKFLEEHVSNYQKAILEMIKNNTDVLLSDISSLVSKPPLDSMDVIRNKFLEVARKNQIVLNIENFDSTLEKYRNTLMESAEKIRKIRVDELSSKVEKFTFHDKTDCIIFYKKDFISLNKSIRKEWKENVSFCLERILLKDISSCFSGVGDLKEKVEKELSQYMKKNYLNQMLENFDIKILVKDTILMNGIKEISDRYLFTLNHSRLFQSEE